jgi:hypothetical protein
MKTKTFLLLCLFIGFGFTRLSAQSADKKDNHVVTYWWTTDGYFPLVCSDVAPKTFLDPDFEWLHATVNIHVVEKWRNGHPYLTLWKVKWENATSTSGEVFKVHETDILLGKYDQNGENVSETDYWFATIIGNWGSQYHIVIKAVYTYLGDDNWDEDYTVIKADCR